MSLWMRIGDFFMNLDKEDTSKTLELSIDEVRLISSMRDELHALRFDKEVVNGWVSSSERLHKVVDHLSSSTPRKQYLVETRSGRLEVAEWLEIYGPPSWFDHYSQEVKDVIKWRLLS